MPKTVIFECRMMRDIRGWGYLRANLKTVHINIFGAEIYGRIQISAQMLKQTCLAVAIQQNLRIVFVADHTFCEVKIKNPLAVKLLKIVQHCFGILCKDTQNYVCKTIILKIFFQTAVY